MRRPGTRGGRAPKSLTGRLLAGSALLTFGALVFTLALMWHVITRFVTGQIDQRLDNKIVALAAQVRASRDGVLRLDGDAEAPPFDKAHTKSFWWIRGPHNDLHSRWLPEQAFRPPTEAAIAALPAPPVPPRPADVGPLEGGATIHARTLETDDASGTALHIRVASRVIDGTRATFFVAAPVEAIAHPVREAMTAVGLGMAALGGALVAATIALVRIGLRPLARVRRELVAIRDGRASSVSTEAPREIAPLVEELNALLAQNVANLERARRHVANLAHGLKTPLATLALALDRVPGEDGEGARRLVTLVERRIRHHLGRARAAALAGPTRSCTPLAPRLADLGETLGRLHAGRSIAFTLACPGDSAVACEPQDVDEIFGNLLDNAFKYTRRAVACSVRVVGRQTIIEIRDDGPGLDASAISRVMQPGQRLDEDVPGHGFGLPIARELIELYGGTLTLEAGDGGLVVTVALPSAG